MSLRPPPVASLVLVDNLALDQLPVRVDVLIVNVELLQQAPSTGPAAMLILHHLVVYVDSDIDLPGGTSRLVFLAAQGVVLADSLQPVILTAGQPAQALCSGLL